MATSLATRGWESILAARDAVFSWAAGQQIPLYRIEFVATFAEWDHGIGVFVFYETRAQLVAAEASGANRRLKMFFLDELEAANYPFAEFPDVSFEFDSHENVVRNFKGSYFYRLR